MDEFYIVEVERGFCALDSHALGSHHLRGTESVHRLTHPVGLSLILTDEIAFAFLPQSDGHPAALASAVYILEPGLLNLNLGLHRSILVDALEFYIPSGFVELHAMTVRLAIQEISVEEEQTGR